HREIGSLPPFLVLVVVETLPLLAGERIDQERPALAVLDGQRLAVGRQRGSCHAPVPRLPPRTESPAFQIPAMDGRVVAHGQQFLAFVEEKKRPNAVVMAGQGVSPFAGLDVPQTDGKPTGRDGLAVRTKGDGTGAVALHSERVQETSRGD